ncbi:MAG: hypothetical protein J2P41_15155 [Blastocatellia bacterium]|nr:hypothetical protein [Blastocatellia bacterium]
MRNMILILLLLPAAGIFDKSQDAAGKAQQLLAQARAAIGGEKLSALKSLSATANYRRTLGENEMSGEIQFDLILPDKIMRSETMNPVPGAEITRIETINGEGAWSDQHSSGMGGAMIFIKRPGGDSPQGRELQANEIRAEATRITLGWLLSAPSSFPIEFAYAGEAEAPDGKADVLEVKGPNRFSAHLFLDQKTHLPLLLTYLGKKPRIIAKSFSGPRSKEEMEKELKKDEGDPAKQPDVEFQIRFYDHRQVSGITLPHHLSRAIDGQVNEEWEISKFKVNPSLKPEKFEKK